jgi:hypothetical protein
MSAPWHCVRFQVSHVAGYQAIQWRELTPETNILLGQNGTGKSTIFEAMIVALHHLAGRHMRDHFVRTYPEATFEVEFAVPGEIEKFTAADTRRRGGSSKTGRDFAILQLVENRQPKSVVGRHSSHWLNNPLQRYEAALSETKRLLLSRQPEEQALAYQVIELCKRVPEAGQVEDWDWIRDETRRRGQTHARPLSCGQFDVLAIALDLIRFQQNLPSDEAPQFVFVDNLETFLHPACLDSTLRMIRYVLPTAQVFVSSHSVKLLLSRPSKSIFWLPREARKSARAEIASIRGLPGGARAAFFELYGDDVSNGVLSLISMLESPHYAEWLAECAHSCGVIARHAPSTDPQLSIAVKELHDHHSSVVFDVGAGAGDLLVALLATEADASEVTYIAFDPAATHPLTEKLSKRVNDAVADHLVGPASTIVRSLDEAPAECDLIALCNVCHAVEIPTLADELACLITEHLRRAENSTLLIIEVRTLGSGEGPFYLWTPEEWSFVFAGIPGLRVEQATLGEPGHPEGIDATFVRWRGSCPARIELSETIEARLREIIPEKRARCLDELLTRQGARLGGHDEAWRQRRVAFLCAQLAWLARAERGLASNAAAAVPS